MPLTSFRSFARQAVAVIGHGRGPRVRRLRRNRPLGPFVRHPDHWRPSRRPRAPIRRRFGNVLNSDVETLVTSTVNGQTVSVPTVFNDPATVTLPRRNEEPAGADIAGRAQRHHHHALSRHLQARGRPEYPGCRRAVRIRRRVHHHGAVERLRAGRIRPRAASEQARASAEQHARRRWRATTHA